MWSPRVYTVSFTATAATVAVDFFELIAGASMGLALLGVDVGQTTELGDTAEEQLRWFVKRASGSYASGSGGNTGVARPPCRSNDAAATFTAETLNTTQAAVGTGTITTIHASTFNVRTGLYQVWTPEMAITCDVSEALVVGLGAAPADSTTFEGTAYVAELI